MTEEVVYRIVSPTLPLPLLYLASAEVPYRMKGCKFPPFLHKIFNDDPQFFCMFSVKPLVVHNFVS